MPSNYKEKNKRAFKAKSTRECKVGLKREGLGCSSVVEHKPWLYMGLNLIPSATNQAKDVRILCAAAVFLDYAVFWEAASSSTLVPFIPQLSSSGSPHGFLLSVPHHP